jgi:hypothetical protein
MKRYGWWRNAFRYIFSRKLRWYAEAEAYAVNIIRYHGDRKQEAWRLATFIRQRYTFLKFIKSGPPVASIYSHLASYVNRYIETDTRP